VSGKAIEADHLSWGSGDVTHQVNSGAGYHVIDFDAAIDSATSSGAGTNLGYLKFFNQAGAELTRFYYAHQQFKVLTGPPPGAQTVIVQGTEFANRRYYHIRFGIDLSASRIDVWVNGVQKVWRAPLYGSGSYIKNITFGQWSANPNMPFTKSETYLDNLVCDMGTAPGATLLLSPMIPWTCWEAYNVFSPFVFYDGAAGHYKMYYSGSAAAQASESVWDLWQTGIATSTDTINWSRREDNYEPVISARKLLEGEVVRTGGDSTEFDTIGAFSPCVLKDGSTYKMWYTGWDGQTEHDSAGITNRLDFRIGYATSTDGKNWTKHPGSAGKGAVLGLGGEGSADRRGAGHPHVLKEGSVYRMWYEGCDGVTWRILYATSADGVNWTKHGAVLSPGGSGSLDEFGARCPVVITRNGQYELWYQGQGSVPPYYRILRATSPDGINWTKAGEVLLNPSSPPSQEGEPAWNANDPTAKIAARSIIVKPDSSCQVFFAKEMTGSLVKTFGTLKLRRYYIFMEVVSP